MLLSGSAVSLTPQRRSPRQSQIGVEARKGFFGILDGMLRPKELILIALLGELLVAANVVCMSRMPPRKLMRSTARRTLRAGFISPENNVDLTRIDSI